jgi:cation/acetate symporter
MIESLDGRTEQQLPDWYRSWSKTGLVAWFDDGDGVLEYRGPAKREDNEIFRIGSLSRAEFGAMHDAHRAFLDSKGEKGADARIELRRRKLDGPDADILVLATPEMARLANWILALLAAGGLAAALSTASGLLLVVSSSVAHDLYYKLLRPDATEAQRLFVGRTTIGVAVVLAGVLGIFPPGFVAQVVAFAFGLAASSFFPVLVLGVFHRRLGTVPAILGMVTGLVFTASYILGTVYFGMPRWCFGLGPQAIGAVGMLVHFAVALGAAPFCRPASPAVQAVVERIREPEGAGPAVAIETAPEH